MVKAPNILEFNSPYDYFEAHYQYRKLKEPGFSYERISEEMGFKSKSFAQMVMNQKRKMTDKFKTVFAEKYISLPEHKEYFYCLTELVECQSESKRTQIQSKMFELRGKLKDLAIIESNKQFWISPEVPKILMVLGFDDFHTTSKNISDFLSLPISLVEDCLHSLQDQGLVDFLPDMSYRPRKKSFKVDSKLGSSDLANYHSHSLSEAQLAQDLPTDVRRYSSFMVAMSPQEFSQFNIEWNNFLKQCVAKYDFSEIENRRLYKINLNIFPVSK